MTLVRMLGRLWSYLSDTGAVDSGWRMEKRIG